MRPSTSDSQKLRYEHYVQFPEDGRRHEIIDGDHDRYRKKSGNALAT